MSATTLDHTPTQRTVRRPVRWAWLAFAAFSLGLAIMLGIMTSGECYRGDCSVAFAGGPIGWVAISALLGQTTWAAVRAFRPASA